MHTRMNMAKKIARAVGTVIKNATWSSTSWREKQKSEKFQLRNRMTITYKETSPMAINAKLCGSRNHFKSRTVQKFKKIPSFILNNHGFQTRSCNTDYLN